MVSSASAEIPEAPRGFAQPQSANLGGVELSAAKLLKVRRKLNVEDTVSMACMMKTTYVVNKKSKPGSTLYVFETLIAVVTKVRHWAHRGFECAVAPTRRLPISSNRRTCVTLRRTPGFTIARPCTHMPIHHVQHVCAARSASRSYAASSIADACMLGHTCRKKVPGKFRKQALHAASSTS